METLYCQSTRIFTERAKGTILAHPIINSALEILDDDKLDKEWVIRNLLGEMAAGFGLRGIPVQMLSVEHRVSEC